MRTPGPLPTPLGDSFTVRRAQDAGVGAGRLRGADLDAPFSGVRSRPTATALADLDTYARQAEERRIQAHRYAPRLREGQFLSHETAVAVHRGPLPTVLDERRVPVDGTTLDVHVSTLGTGPLVRAAGVSAHRADPRTTALQRVSGLLIADPATVWAELGAWSVPDLVALGDYFCRVHRAGPGRPNAGRPPLATITELRDRITGVRRRGIRRLREAVELVREDSWSPRESKLRCVIVRAGLPEPLLNHDIYDDRGFFIGCFDLVYPDQKVAIEYHGTLHAAQYADDVERIAALRAAGWTVIEVTKALFAHPGALVDRIRRALDRSL